MTDEVPGMGSGLTYRDVYGGAPRPPRPPWWKRWRVRALIGLAVVALAAGGYLFLAPTPGFEVKGSLQLAGDGASFRGLVCTGKGGFSDIGPGATIVVTEASGTTIAVGELGAGRAMAGGCRFEFTITIPEGHDFYGIEVTHRGRLQYSRERLNEPLSLSLG